MKQNLFASFLLALSPLGLALACGTAAPDGPGGIDALAGGSGSTGATTGGAASGETENLTAQMTIHHNWFRDLNQRNPSTDNVLRAHLYNNWLQRIDSYGNYAHGGTNMVLENSIFDTVNRPHYHDDGTLVAAGNIYRSTSGDKESSGSTYSFFDPSDFYEYSLDPADQVEALLTRCAGPRPELGL